MVKKLGSSSTCDDVVEFVANLPKNIIDQVNSSTSLVTGANTGIGKANAKALAKLGGHVILAGRTLEKVLAAKEEIEKEVVGSGQLLPMKIDHTNLSTVKAFTEDLIQRIESKEIPPLRLIVLNAGMLPEKPELSPDGINIAFQANHLGHFYMIRELIKCDPNVIFLNGECRIVIVSSNAHKLFLATKKVTDRAEVLHKVVGIPQPGKKPYVSAGLPFYGNTKLANIYFAQSLNELPSSATNGLKIEAVAVHPGLVLTRKFDRFSAVGILQRVLGWSAKSLDQGASTQFFVSLAPAEMVKGKYFSDCKSESASKLAQGEIGKLARRLLWELSDDIANKIISQQPLN